VHSTGYKLVLITVETELIHTIDGLDCLFEFPEIQFAFSCYLCFSFLFSSSCISIRYQIYSGKGVWLLFFFFFIPNKYLIYPISKYELKLNYYFSFSFNEAWQRSLKPFEQQKGKDMSFFLACPHKREEGGFELVAFASLGVVSSRLSYSFGDIKDRV
jgi:hypothetical protein